MTGIILDNFTAPNTSQNPIKDSVSIITSIIALLLTVIGLYIANNGLSTWKKQLKTDKTINALEDSLNEIDIIKSTCWKAEHFQEILERKIDYTQSNNTFDDTKINDFKKACTEISKSANQLLNFCDKPLVDPILKNSCQSVINASGEIWGLSFQLEMHIEDHKKIRLECFKPEHNGEYPEPERAGIDEMQKVQKTMTNIKRKLKELKSFSLTTKETLKRINFK